MARATSNDAWAERTEGFLAVSDEQQIWWCEVGDRTGIPLLVVHGGPGGGSLPAMIEPYDLDVFRVVMFDQRGCGRSRPHASDPSVSLVANTTSHLINDMESLREHLEIDSWVLSGSSWGSTLALAYLCAHADRVRAVVLRSITTYSPAEMQWVYADGANQLLPEAWDEFATTVAAGPDRDLVTAYREALLDADAQTRFRAALGWCRWELAGMRAEPGSAIESIFTQPAFATAFARISTHYAAHHGFIDHDLLWATIPTLGNIPSVLVQGRYDLCTPPVTAWRLHRRWPGSRLQILEDEGHRLTGATATMQQALKELTRSTP